MPTPFTELFARKRGSQTSDGRYPRTTAVIDPRVAGARP